jgi:uncharacterized membrane protein
MELIGRLHPLVVHLPIGILLMAFLLEVLSRFRGYKKLKASVNITVAIGTASALMACVSGWILSQEGGYDENLVGQHQISGIATAIVALVVLAIFYGIKSFQKGVQKKIRLFSFFPLVILISITGHLGGSLTHGEDFLFQKPSNQKTEPLAAQLILPADINQAIIYGDLVKPLLEAKCYECHSSKKQKGKLRLDGEEWILKGGKSGSAISSGNLAQSELLKRILLPLEEKDHMPPRNKTQLSSGEIDLLSQWIKGGASFAMKVAESKDSAFFKNTFANTSHQAKNWWPTESVAKPDENNIRSLRQDGIVVDFLAADNNYLLISLPTYDTFPSLSWQKLIPLKDQIISLHLSRLAMSASDWTNLSQLKKLRVLHADKTSLTDHDMDALVHLSNLTLLNLAGTKITDEGLKKLSAMKSLQQLYLFESNCTPAGVAQLQKELPNCAINLGGYSLPALISDTLEYRPKPFK